MNLYFLAGSHGDGERDALEAGDQVECSLFWYGVKALGGVGADDQGAGWFGDSDVLGSGWSMGSVDREMTGRMNRSGVGGGVCGGCDFDGGWVRR